MGASAADKARPTASAAPDFLAAIIRCFFRPAFVSIGQTILEWQSRVQGREGVYGLRVTGRHPAVARDGAQVRRSRADPDRDAFHGRAEPQARSEEHTSELQSRFGISYAVFCLKKTN